MQIPKSVFVPVLVGVFAAGAFVFPHTAFAGDVCAPGQSQEQCLQVRTTVLSKLDNDINVSADAGLTGCDDQWFGIGTCGVARAPSAGSNNATGSAFGEEPVSWQQGDMVKCVGYSGGDTYCAITHNPGTSNAQTSYYDVGPFHTDTVTGNSNGQGPVTGALNTTNSPVLSCAEDLGGCILRVVSTAILTFANFLLGIAGVLFNLIVVRTVFQFGSIIGNSPGVLIAWGILRDIANMALLFGFIFMGIATILNTNGLHNYTAKEALPKLLIFAILMNFSLFACEAVIDTANAISSVMYAQANTESTQCTGISGTSGTTADGTCNNSAGLNLNTGIAGRIMSSTGLSTINSLPASATFNNQAVTYLGLAVFATVGAIVLFSATIMFAIRLVVLTFLMIVSPIGFAGMALPPLQKFANDWWTRVIHQSFYAPVFLLLIFISLKVADSFSTVAGSNGGLQTGLAAAVNTPDASSIDIILVFTLVIGFLVASMAVANKFGAAGASFAVGTARKLVLGSYGGIAGFTGRRTVGAGGNYLQKKYQSAAGRSPGFRKFALATGLDEGIMSLTDKAKSAKFGSSKSFADKEKRNKERTEVLEREGRKAQMQIDLDEALKMPTLTPANRQDREDRIATILERMSVSELEEVGALKKTGESLDLLVKNLSPEKFAALVKEGSKFSEAQKNGLRESRFKDIRDQQKILDDPASTLVARRAAQTAIDNRIKQFSVRDLENAPANLLTEDRIAMGLNNKQREDLLKNGKLSPAAARKVRQFDPVEQVNAAPTHLAAAGLVRRLRLAPKQVARLNNTVLASRNVTAILTTKMLQAIQERNEIDDVTAQNIKAGVLAGGLPNSIDYILNNPAGVAYWS